MTRAHFAGLNTRDFADVLTAQPVLISNADIVRRPGVWRDRILPRLVAGMYDQPILDSGAFTELSTPGFHVSVSDYVELIREVGHHFDQVVTLDDIGGDLARTWRNTAELQDRTGRQVVPVFHGREPWAVLRLYCERFDRIGLGFARKIVGSRAVIDGDQGQGLGPDTWLAVALGIAAEYGVETHGFGMTRYAMARGHDRLTTTDSTTWISEFRALKSPEWVTGPARERLSGLDSIQLAYLTTLSYRATGRGRAACTVGATGQARTALARFSEPELDYAIQLAGIRFEAQAEAA